MEPGAGRRLSPAITAACAVVVAVLIAFLVWPQSARTRIDAMATPERALALIVGRSLDTAEALDHASPWERRLYRLTITTGGQELRDGLAWFEELAGLSLDPRVDVGLAILEGEAGRRPPLRQAALEWQRRPEPFPSLADLLSIAYLDTSATPEDARALLDAVEDDIPEGWFHDRLVTRVAARTGDGDLVAATAAALTARTRPLLGRIRGLAVVLLALVLAGLAGLSGLARRAASRPAALRLGAAPLPPPWRGRVGAAVVVRGAAAGGILWVGLGLTLYRFFALDDAFVGPTLVLVIAAPLLLLARRHLLAPAGLDLPQAMGLWPLPGARGDLVRVTAVLVAAGFVGDLALGLLGEWRGQSIHWTEWFDSGLAWGGPATVAASLLGAVVVAPIVEEIAFRGLLYGTLRRKWGVGPAAVVSAAVFALAHGYGMWGFASVFFSGLLWAVTYEKTRSLLPAIAAHAVGNLATALALLALLRG